MLKIRQLLKSEINLLQNFPPEGWNLDLPGFVCYHFGYSYFYPVAAEVENRIVGFGNGILNDKTGWLGNIIVLSEFRRKGIGYEITKHLVEYFNKKGCATQLLIASEMGENIYSKIGFKVSSEYHFFRKESESPVYMKDINIRKIREEDYSFVKKFDEGITGEKRYDLIKRFFSTGWVYRKEKFIEGVYLPELGSGLIFAKNNVAGLELLKFKLSSVKTKTVIPSGNKSAINFLINEGYQIDSTAPRMVLGKDVSWKPEYIFNRASGYCG